MLWPEYTAGFFELSVEDRLSKGFKLERKRKKTVLIAYEILLHITVCKSLKLIDIYLKILALLKQTFTPYIYILFFLIQIPGAFAQNYKLDIRTGFQESQATFDLDKVKKDILSIDSIDVELSNHIDKLQLRGYLEVRVDSLIKSDSVCVAYLSPGKRLEFIKVFYDHISKDNLKEKDLKPFVSEINASYFLIPFVEIPNFMNSVVTVFESKGDSFVKLSLDKINLQNQEASATLKLERNFIRRIDKVVVKGYENFPKNYINHELNLKTGSIFNKEKIELASRAINNLRFADERKPPEVLFTNDSTIIYLYLTKKKSNQFDGIIGFASKEESNGIEFNGYLDLSINNIFNSGETIGLYWKNNGENRQRFYLEAEVPYIFNLPLSPKANFELYRQDSTFNNVKANISLLYNFAGKGQLAAEFSTENSNDLSNGNAAGIASYSNMFYGLSYNFRLLTPDALFPVKFNLGFSALLGSRTEESNTTDQLKILFDAHYLYPINNKNYVFLRNSSGLLNSDNYFENELFRIGGINNLRGVNEESIFASSYTIFNVEYRFKPNSSSYFYSITDFSYSENKLILENSTIISLGLGYAFRTKAGILNLSYAIGKFNDNPFTFDNSKVHIKILSNF